MALIKCKECGEEISTKAKSCPKCGVVTPKKTSLITWFVLFMMILGGYLSNTNVPSRAVTPSSTTSSPAQKWTTSTSVDPISGGKHSFTTSPSVRPTEIMDFPYNNNIEAYLDIGCDGKKEWVCVVLSEKPILTDFRTEDGYERGRVRIRWDDAFENVFLQQRWGDNVLMFEEAGPAIKKIVSSSSALLEVPWYGQGSVYFRFPLNGSSTALAGIRSQCSKY